MTIKIASAAQAAMAVAALASVSFGCATESPGAGGPPPSTGGSGGSPVAGAGGTGAGGSPGPVDAITSPEASRGTAVDAGAAEGGAPANADAGPDATAPATGLPGPTGAACPVGASYGQPLPANPTVTLVSDDVQVAEGPLWIAGQKALYLTEIEGPPRIYRYTPADKMLVTWVDRVGVNGLSLDPQGHIVAASPDLKQLTRFDIDTKARTPIAGSDMFEGKRFNSVNDVIVRADGQMYFSDPGFMTSSTPQPTAYYHLAPGAAAATRLGTGPNPNALGIPADGKYLYVTSSPSNAAEGRVWRHPLRADGTAGPRTELINQRSESLAIDCAGNLYLSFAGKILVYTPEGQKITELGTITAGITNLTFGGEDTRTLYITARGGLYQTTVLIPGLPN